MDRIEDLRKEIDRIDMKIVQALSERARLVLKIRELKEEMKLPLRDPQREAEIIEKVTQSVEDPLSKESIKQIYQYILDQMRTFNHNR